MAIKTYNVPPYYDDFDPTKNYLRVLFRPGHAVQARELTQLQTAIQAQIERFGSHIFKNGSQVIGGQPTLDTKYAYIKLESTFSYDSTSTTSFLIGTGLKSFTTQADLAYVTGEYVLVSDAALPNDNWMKGQVTSYSGTTLTINVTETNGTGTYANWKISVSYYPEGQNIGSGGAAAYIDEAVGHTIKLVTDTSGVEILATILEFVPSTTDDYLTAYVRYTQANQEYHVFSAESVLVSTTAPTYKFKVAVATDAPTGYGSRVAVNEGVYYVNGNFVYTPAESLIVSKYSEYPSARLVYKISENIVTSAEDPSLVDNALGTPNDSAPGAHRYQIRLDLSAQPLSLTQRTEADIIQLLVVNAGVITARARTEYSELANTLATRTYEESGNYTVRPFLLNIREWYNDGTNNGLYTAPQIAIMQGFTGGTATAEAIAYGSARLAVGLEPAVAYVNGYRIETLATSYVEVEKARETAYINSAALSVSLGGYVYIDTLVGIPDITTYSTITLKNGSAATIGTARARGLQYVSGTIGMSTAVYKLFLFDINISTGTGNPSFSDVRTLTDTTVPGPYDFSAAINDIDPTITDAVLYDTATSSLVYKLPTTATSSLRSLDNNIDLIYSIRRTLVGQASGSNIVSLSSVSQQEVFSSGSASDYVCIRNDTGVVVNPVSVTRSEPAATSIQINMGTGAGVDFTVIAPMTRTNVTAKTKTLEQDYQVTFAEPNDTLGSYDILGITDALRIKGIYMSADFDTVPSILTDPNPDPDVKDRYELDNGQRENFYDVARIRLKPGSSAPTGQITVVVDYFSHGSGDYFCVNSYNPGLYDLIPSFNSIKGKIELRDAIDFRPTKNTSGSGFTAPGADVTNTVQPGSLLFTDIQYYMPRSDKIYVNKTGDFGVQYGISSTKPAAPADVADSMTLYVLSLGAYTFSTSDLTATLIDSRRYTMRDIGRLEKRISNVEYYTSLSLLEKETAAKQITDGTSQRYKNGFVVDAFTGHGIGAITHPDYHCSVDPEKGVLRPEFYQDNVALVVNLADPATLNIKKTGPLITLNYNEVTAISQPYASYGEYVNPHSVYGWHGQIKISPPGDDWKETQVKPQLAANADSQLNWFKSVNADAAAKTIWNAWSTSWYGIEGNGATYNNEDFTGDSVQSFLAQRSGTATRAGFAALSSGTYNLTTTQSFNNSVVDTSIVAYIRSRKVYFTAQGLKPNSKLYAFFDGVNIGDYVSTNDTYVEYSSSADTTNYLDVTSHPSGATDLVTNSSGSISGSFIIPNNSQLKFSTGNRIFRLIDNLNNNVSSAFTYVDVTYTAKGILETHQTTVTSSTVISTVQPQIRPVSNPAAAIVYNLPVQPRIQPAAEISVEGQLPKYAGIPWNFNIGAQGNNISSVKVYGRSGAFGSSSSELDTSAVWVQESISGISGSTPSSGAIEATARVSAYAGNQGGSGAYQWKIVAVIDGQEVVKTTNVIPFTNIPPDAPAFNPTNQYFYRPPGDTTSLDTNLYFNPNG